MLSCIVCQCYFVLNLDCFININFCLKDQILQLSKQLSWEVHFNVNVNVYIEKLFGVAIINDGVQELNRYFCYLSEVSIAFKSLNSFILLLRSKLINWRQYCYFLQYFIFPLYFEISPLRGRVICSSSITKTQNLLL